MSWWQEQRLTVPQEMEHWLLEQGTSYGKPSEVQLGQPRCRDTCVLRLHSADLKEGSCAAMAAPGQASGSWAPSSHWLLHQFWKDTAWPHQQGFILWHKRSTQKVVKPGRESILIPPPSVTPELPLGYFGKFDKRQNHLEECLCWQRKADD